MVVKMGSVEQRLAVRVLLCVLRVLRVACLVCGVWRACVFARNEQKSHMDQR